MGQESYLTGWTRRHPLDPSQGCVGRRQQDVLGSVLMLVQMRKHARVLAIALLLLGCARSPAPVVSAPAPRPGVAVADQIAAWLGDASRPLPAGGQSTREVLLRAYRARDYRPIWLGQTQQSAQLLDALGQSAQEGVDPRDLGVDRLQAAQADRAMSDAAKDLLFSESFLSYATLLAQGRVDPALIENDWALPRPIYDPAVALSRAAATLDVANALDALAPTAPDYVTLRAALKLYRDMRAAGPWPRLAAGTKLALGDRGPPVDLLRARLAAEGYLPTADHAGDPFDAALDLALRRFQARHGVAVDGRMGPETLAALNVGPDERIQEIKLNLERQREMAHSWPRTRIVVNVAAQALTLYRDGAAVLESPVIVGDLAHPTPVMGAEVGAVIFNPPWDVPVSILRHEIQPRLRRDPEYLARNRMTILGRSGGDPYGRGLDWRHTDIPARGWRLQQQPGSWNSLGVIVLEMPNPFDVYVHDTPGKAAFSQAFRALSHGCVRVQEIRELAVALLGGILVARIGGTDCCCRQHPSHAVASTCAGLPCLPDGLCRLEWRSRIPRRYLWPRPPAGCCSGTASGGGSGHCRSTEPGRQGLSKQLTAALAYRRPPKGRIERMIGIGGRRLPTEEPLFDQRGQEQTARFSAGWDSPVSSALLTKKTFAFSRRPSAGT